MRRGGASGAPRSQRVAVVWTKGRTARRLHGQWSRYDREPKRVSPAFDAGIWIRIPVDALRDSVVAGQRPGDGSRDRTVFGKGNGRDRAASPHAEKTGPRNDFAGRSLLLLVLPDRAAEGTRHRL